MLTVCPSVRMPTRLSWHAQHSPELPALITEIVTGSVVSNIVDLRHPFQEAVPHHGLPKMLGVVAVLLFGGSSDETLPHFPQISFKS